MKWIIIDPFCDLGYLPSFLSEEDLRPAWEQLDENYAHGGGWHPSSGWTLTKTKSLQSQYPEDSPLRMRAFTKLRDEFIALYDADYVLILQPDGTYEVSRVD